MKRPRVSPKNWALSRTSLSVDDEARSSLGGSSRACSHTVPLPRLLLLRLLRLLLLLLRLLRSVVDTRQHRQR